MRVEAYNRLIVKSKTVYIKKQATTIGIVIKHLFLSLKAENGAQGTQDP